MGTLYLVATPIGNLEDMTLRAIRILREARVIAAEDTRRTRTLLTHFDIRTPLLSYHAHNEQARVAVLLQALAEGDVALVTDAGMPGVSDPGAVLVTAAHAGGYAVSPVPGASALTAAIAASGLIEGPFTFLGFLPRSGQARRGLIGRAGATGMACVIFESPQRIAATLGELAAAWGDRPAALMRELTKLHEQVKTGSLASLTTEVSGKDVKGELVLVVGAAPAAGAPAGSDEDAQILRSLRTAGLSASAAAREAAVLTGRPRSELYALAQTLERGAANPTGTPASGDGPESTAANPAPGGTSRGTRGPD